MAFVLKDRVKETTTSAGTGAISLGGASATFATFQSLLSDGDTTYYAIVHTGSGVDEWEVGLGTWNTGNTLTRTTVIAGTNDGSPVDFSAGIKDIFMTYPASIAAYTDASGDLSGDIGLGNHSTTELVEGSNLYYTDARVDAHLSGGTGVTYNAGAISIGQDVATTADVTFNTVTGDLTGNADTATALESSRTIQLTGDVTGSATFNGTANAVITATVQDDSHSHVIANVDGLQSALDAKADDSTTITAGSGLTGGGSIGVNRTISHADTSAQASLTALTGAAVVSDVDVDTYGHVTGLATRNMTLADLGFTGETNATADQTITAGAGLTGGGTGNVTLNHADTSAQGSVNNSGATVIQDVTLDTYGHVTGLASTALTPATIGAATSAQGALADSAVQPNDSPTFAGINTTGNATFGDNDKAIFGAGSDLQIYHDGSNSIVADSGTGDLELRGSNLKVSSATGSLNFIETNSSGNWVKLKWNSDEKLATTSTGVDVTGTLTSDGLTVDGSAEIRSHDGTSLNIVSTDNSIIDTQVYGNLNFISEDGSLEGGRKTVAGLEVVNRGGSGSYAAMDFYTSGGTGATTTSPRLRIDYNGDISFYEDTGTTPKFFWDASAENLLLFNTAGTSFNNGGLQIGSGDGIGDYALTSGFNVAGEYGYVQSTKIGSYFTDIALNPNGGNVGIGTSSPDEKLEVYQGNIKLGTDSNTTSKLIFERSAANRAEIYVNNLYHLQFDVAGSERMRIDSSGNVGIGTSSPDSSLHVEKTGTAASITVTTDTNRDANVYFGDTSSSSQGRIQYSNASDSMALHTNGSERMRIDSSGNLLVGTTSGSDKITVNGTVSATNFNTTSDATLKTNVETLTGSLDAVKSLRGVSFDWIENGGSEVGFIAQEVEEVIPDVVSTNDQGIKSVKYGNVVALLVEALKEQQLRIEALEAKLEG